MTNRKMRRLKKRSIAKAHVSMRWLEIEMVSTPMGRNK
jgi:hypothetical protein